MTTAEIKSEIHKAIENLPDNALPDLVNYLNSIAQQYPNTSYLKEIVDRIISEDHELLKRLAE